MTMTPETIVHTEALIIGSGPAGYTAALYLARYGRNPTLVQGKQPGGQLTITADVENYPGIPLPVHGPQLMQDFATQAETYGTTLVADYIHRVDFSSWPLVCYGEAQRYVAKTVIIATGASAKWLGLAKEQSFWGFGVSACATCDGPLFRGKDVAVVGGGNSAVEEALFLSRHANSVLLIHRRHKLRAEQLLQNRLKADKKISILWDSEVVDLHAVQGKRTLGSITVQNVHTKEQTIMLIGGLFVAIGHEPNTGVFQPWLQTTPEGYLLPQRMISALTHTARDPHNSPSPPHHGSVNPWDLLCVKTEIPGVFKAGDVSDSIYRQAVTAAGMGCQAAIDAERFLQEASIGALNL